MKHGASSRDRRGGATLRVVPLAAVHLALDDTFASFRELVLVGDGARASEVLEVYRVLTAAHAEAEERLLLPVTPAARRWPDELYRGQHVKLLAGIERVAPLVPAIAGPSPGWRTRALAALDAAGPLLHLSEHHHQAEESDLFLVVARAEPARLDEVAREFWASHAAVRDVLARAAL